MDKAESGDQFSSGCWNFLEMLDPCVDRREITESKKDSGACRLVFSFSYREHTGCILPAKF